MKTYSFLQEAGFIQGARKMAANGFTKMASSPKTAGAVAGAGVGALSGMKRDGNGERHILRNMAIGAGVGTAAGAGGAALGKKLGGKNWINNGAKAIVGTPAKTATKAPVKKVAQMAPKAPVKKTATAAKRTTKRVAGVPNSVTNSAML